MAEDATGSRALRLGVGALLLAAGAALVRISSGVLFWSALGVAGVGLVRLVSELVPGGATRRSGTASNATLAIGSIAVALALTEAALGMVARSAGRPPPTLPSVASPPPSPELPEALRAKIERMQDAFVMPDAWQHRELPVVGERKQSYYWHEALHVFDAERMRREEPFPPRDPTRLRILAVGDSLTYGEGIAAEWTWPAQLERALASERDVEVLNLGIPGHSSEDVVDVVRRFVPRLEPDLVAYGMCLNDFLPSRALQPVHYRFPLPRKWKRSAARKTRVGRLLEERYGALLRRLGLRPDFYSELLADFAAHRARFARDVAELNGVVTGAGLPPVIAMVLDQAPLRGGAGQQLARAAEEAMREAGMDVIGSEDFYRRFDRRNLRVSRWEGHPNEEANAIWADHFARAVRARDALRTTRRDAVRSP